MEIWPLATRKDMLRVSLTKSFKNRFLRTRTIITQCEYFSDEYLSFCFIFIIFHQDYC